MRGGGGHAWRGGECVAGGMHGSGEGHVWQGACMAGGMHDRGHAWGWRHAWQGGMHGRGHAWQWEACVAGACMTEGMHGGWGMHGRGHAWQRTCVAGGVHATHTPRHHEIWSVNARVVRILLECILVDLNFILFISSLAQL